LYLITACSSIKIESGGFMSLFRLIYKSTSTQTLDFELLSSIMAASEVHNKSLNITGMLIASKTKFIQILEGEGDSVNKIYKNIIRDKRHTDIILLSYSPIEERLFKQWSMKAVSLHDAGKGLISLLKDKYGESNGDFILPDDPCTAFSMFFDVKYYLKS
jgi:hypothetical protein